MDIYYNDGHFVPADKAVISVSDLALLRGYGVFDFLRTYNGRPFYLDAHIQRLETSAALIDLELPWSREDLCAIVNDTLAQNSHPESNVRILVTGGESLDGLMPIGKSRLIVMVSKLIPPPAAWYERGVKLSTSHIPRLFPGAKSTNYIAGIRALAAARKAGAVESLYVGRNSQMLECVTSNFFGFIGGKLVTPSSDILPGITREVVLGLSREVFDVHIRDMHLQELDTLDEAFITSSTKEVLPVVQVDDKRIGNGLPGPGTRRLMALFKQMAAAYGRSVA